MNTNFHTESRMRENCTYGSMRGIRRKTAKHVLRVAEGRAGVPDEGRPALLYTLWIQGYYYFLGEGANATLKMAGGSVSRFGKGGGANNEYLRNVVVADGTVSEWWNHRSRTNDGDTGVNLNIVGDVTGGGILKMSIRSVRAPRAYRFSKDFSKFTGTIEMNGPSYQFYTGFKGGTAIANPGANISGNMDVDNATLILKNNNPEANITIGKNAKLGASAVATAKNLTFVEGAKLELVDDGALGDSKMEYVAITSPNPIAGPLPTIANANAVTTRGKWKLVQRANKKTVTAPDTGVESEVTESYSLVAQFRPKGFCIILQ